LQQGSSPWRYLLSLLVRIKESVYVSVLQVNYSLLSSSYLGEHYMKRCVAKCTIFVNHLLVSHADANVAGIVVYECFDR
jgi:hypothetical protein